MLWRKGDWRVGCLPLLIILNSLREEGAPAERRAFKTRGWFWAPQESCYKGNFVSRTTPQWSRTVLPKSLKLWERGSACWRLAEQQQGSCWVCASAPHSFTEARAGVRFHIKFHLFLWIRWASRGRGRVMWQASISFWEMVLKSFLEKLVCRECFKTLKNKKIKREKN